MGSGSENLHWDECGVCPVLNIELGTGHYATTGGGTTKPSWVYQDEFGTWHRAYPQKPRPYLKPAAADHAEEYRNLLKQSLENA